MDIRLFVYGTLQSGGGNHLLLARGRYLGDCGVLGVLYDLGGIPAATFDTAAPMPVRGEAWAVPAEDVEAIDRLEGTARQLYARVEVPVAVGPLAGQTVHAYQGERVLAGPRSRVVADGRWEPFAHSSK